MEVAPFFVDFHHFLSIFTIFYRFSRFTHFCRDLHFVGIYALFPQIYFGQNSLLRNITRFLHVCPHRQRPPHLHINSKHIKKLLPLFSTSFLWPGWLWNAPLGPRRLRRSCEERESVWTSHRIWGRRWILQRQCYRGEDYQGSWLLLFNISNSSRVAVPWCSGQLWAFSISWIISCKFCMRKLNILTPPKFLLTLVSSPWLK